MYLTVNIYDKVQNDKNSTRKIKVSIWSVCSFCEYLRFNLTDTIYKKFMNLKLNETASFNEFLPRRLWRKVNGSIKRVDARCERCRRRRIQSSCLSPALFISAKCYKNRTVDQLGPIESDTQWKISRFPAFLLRYV